MVPINEVLIAKIVLGYLSSRDLSSTADCFVKECEGFHSSNESGTCEKERILNHLEGLNLLPSLEEILKDYFAYQGPDEVATDKVYLLWKQLDVVIGQLRAITLGKTKAKAFMSSRRAPKTFCKLIDKTVESNQLNISQYIDNATTNFDSAIVDLQNTQKVPHKDLETKDNFMLSEGSLEKIVQNKLLTPFKEHLKESNKKEFKSPRRKPRHPRRNTNADITSLTEDKVKNFSELSSDVPLNKEFSDLVAALISNDKLSIKLADNINKVVSVEPKLPSKDEEDIVDEIIKLTADDPDLNILFSMLGGHQHVTQEATRPVNNHFDINTAIESTTSNMGTSAVGSYIELQPAVTSTANAQIEVVDSNLQSTFTDLQPADTSTITQMNTVDTNLQPFLMQSSYTNFLEILNSDYPCIRDLNDEFSDYTDKIQTSYEPLNLPEAPKILGENPSSFKTVEEITPTITHKCENKLSSPPNELLTSPHSISPNICDTENSQCEEMNDKTVECDLNNERVDDSEILASHALLQLSTSPMKLSASSNIENVISKPTVSPQALTSNGKISREPICSTSCNVQDKPGDKKPPVNEVMTHGDEITISQNVSLSDLSNEICVTQQNTLPYENNVLSHNVNSKDDKKQTRKKRGKIKSSNTETLRDNITVSLLETEDTTYKKPKRSKEITVTQLDFNPLIPSRPVNRPNQSRNKIVDEKGINNAIFVDPLLTTSALNSMRSPTSIAINISPKIVVTDKCDALSPACLLHAQFNTLNGKSRQGKMEVKNENGASSILAKKTLPVAEELQVISECSTVKPCVDQFQTFRIKGNAISNVCSLGYNRGSTRNFGDASSDTTLSCKSKTLSMVINNTDSLSNISSGISDAKDSSADNYHQVSSNNLQKTSSQHASSTSNMASYIPSISTNSTSNINIRKKRCITSKLASDNLYERREKDSVVSKAFSNNPCEKREKDSVVSKLPSDNPSKEREKDYVDTKLPGDNPSKTREEDSVVTKLGSDNDSERKEKDAVTSSLVGDLPFLEREKDSLTSVLDNDFSSKKREIDSITLKLGDDTPSEKRVKDHVTSKLVSDNPLKKKEKDSITTKSNRNIPSKKMTVKFNFRKSPMRKKAYNFGVEDTAVVDIKEEETIKDVDNIYKNYDTHEVLQERKDIESFKDTSTCINPITSTIEHVSSDISSIENQENICTESVLDCLKTSCYIQVSSSNASHNKLNKENEERTSVLPNNPHIITPNTNTTSVSTVDILQASPCASQSLQSGSEKNDELKVGVQSADKTIKRKAKRKRNLSLLMLNVDNVAQLLSGIDYS